jgi:hypothetical protein
MTLRQQIRPRVLRAIRAADGVPVPGESVIGAVLPFVVGATASDVREQIVVLENENFLVSELDPLTEIRSYALTGKGALEAKK